MNYAIVLAGGSGKRMGLEIPKQFLEICGRPVLYYSLFAFNESPVIDEIILVTRKQDEEVCRQIVKKYDLNKVKHITEGGRERHESVYNGLKEITDGGYVYIHDGARPCITPELIFDLSTSVEKYSAVYTAVPAKDTIRVVDEAGFTKETPRRKSLWQVQTPQVFAIDLLKRAYAEFRKDANPPEVTDDAMLVDGYTGVTSHVHLGSYSNLKLTTGEDIPVIEKYLSGN